MAIDVATSVRKIFVVIDPKRLLQAALEKGEWIAERNRASLHLYCCVYDTDAPFDSAAQDQLLTRTTAWLDRLAERPRAEGLRVTLQVESNPDWRKAVAAAAAQSDSELVVKTASPHGPLMRRLMETSDWTLLRDCARPMLLVNANSSTNTKTVLAAVKVTPDDAVHIALNEDVVNMSHRIAHTLGAELHAVTVYKGDGMYFDRQHFADQCRLPRNHVHATEGSSSQGIAEIAEKIGAGVLIIGCARDPGGRSVVGATAQRVIDEVRSDVVVLPAA